MSGGEEVSWVGAVVSLTAGRGRGVVEQPLPTACSDINCFLLGQSDISAPAQPLDGRWRERQRNRVRERE